MPARRILPLVAALLAAGLIGCTGTDNRAADPPPSTTTTAPDEPGEPVERSCERPVEDAPEVEPVPDTPADHRLVSFDDTEIRIHWFPAPDADEPAPTVLSGPGWSLPGETSPEASVLFGSVGIGALNERGYNVLTWDPRGFGDSTGTVTVDHPDFEGRDVSRIIDWLATQPEVLLDAPGDPRIGMIGSSYGGGIQLAVASRDCRVDALVPGLAWNSLETSLYPNETVKTGWAGGLIAAAAAADLDPHITRAHDDGVETGRIGDAEADWFRDRGPDESVADITAPTLLVHGTVDTLFAPGESITNFEILHDAGVPTALTWFCGGHGTCLTSDGRTDFVEAATLAWLDRWLRDDDSVELPPTFQTVDQNGDRWIGDHLPEPDETLTGTGDGELHLSIDSTAGPIEESGGDVLSFLVDSFTPARARIAVDVPITVDDLDGLAFGAPTLRLSYTGTAGDDPDGGHDADRPARVFAQLVDEASGRVVGNQITPIPLVLDGGHHETEIPLEAIAHRIRPGDRLTLQISATTVAYALPRLGGTVSFDRIEIDVPVATNGPVICGSDEGGLGCPPLR